MFLLSAVLLAPSLFSAGISFDKVNKTDLNAEISEVQVNTQAVPEISQDKGILDWLFGKGPKEWTIMVFSSAKNDQVKATGQAFMKYITGSLVMHNRARDSEGGYWSGPKQYTLSKGMAMYLPSYSVGDGYADLAWAKASRWDELGAWLIQP